MCRNCSVHLNNRTLYKTGSWLTNILPLLAPELLSGWIWVSLFAVVNNTCVNISLVNLFCLSDCFLRVDSQTVTHLSALHSPFFVGHIPATSGQLPSELSCPGQPSPQVWNSEGPHVIQPGPPTLCKPATSPFLLLGVSRGMLFNVGDLAWPLPGLWLVPGLLDP